MNGYELLQRLRTTPSLSGVKFIAVTGYGQAEDRERIYKAGFYQSSGEAGEYDRPGPRPGIKAEIQCFF